MEKLRLKKSAITKYLEKGGTINTLAGILGVVDSRTMKSYITRNSVVLTCESVLLEIQDRLKISRSELLEEAYPGTISSKNVPKH